MQRFTALDGFRGLLALAVALYHLPVASHLFATTLLREAYLCVDFFFALSGFVIAHAYADELRSAAAAGRFMWRRVGRLWPLHVAVLVILIAIEIAKLVFAAHLDGDMRRPFTGEAAPFAILTNLLLIQDWGMHATTTWNLPSWSISAEIFAYLVFAGVTLLLGRRAPVAALTIVAIAALVIVTSSSNIELTAHFGIVRACYGFFAGSLAYAAYRRSRWLHTLSRIEASALEILAIGLVLAYVASVHGSALGMLAPPLFAVVVYLFAAGAGIVSSLLSSAPAQFLGRVSYSTYMVHGLVISAIGAASRVLEKLLHQNFHETAAAIFGAAAPADTTSWVVVDFGNFWVNDTYGVLYLGLVLGLAALTYRFIELPGQRLFARLATPRPLPAPAIA